MYRAVVTPLNEYRKAPVFSCIGYRCGIQVTSTSISPLPPAVAFSMVDDIRRKASGSFHGTIRGHFAPVQDTLTATTVVLVLDPVMFQAERAVSKNEFTVSQADAGLEMAPREGSDEKKLKLMSGAEGVSGLRDGGGSVRLDDRVLIPAATEDDECLSTTPFCEC